MTVDPARLPLIVLGVSLLAATGCGTILGTAAGPITGAVDLVRETRSHNEDFGLAEFGVASGSFLGGALAGPFVGFYAGALHDASFFADPVVYFQRLPTIFRPFHSLRPEDQGD